MLSIVEISSSDIGMQFGLEIPQFSVSQLSIIDYFYQLYVAMNNLNVIFFIVYIFSIELSTQYWMDIVSDFRAVFGIVKMEDKINLDLMKKWKCVWCVMRNLIKNRKARPTSANIKNIKYTIVIEFIQLLINVWKKKFKSHTLYSFLRPFLSMAPVLPSRFSSCLYLS